MKKIKIALFVPWLKSKGGVERALLMILSDKKYDTDIYTFFYDKDATFDEFKKYNITVLRNSAPNGFIMRGISLFGAILRAKIPNLRDYDIFMISTAGIAELITFRNRHRTTVALCHTPLRAAHTMYDYYRSQDLKNSALMPIFSKVYTILERAAWKNIGYALVFSNEVKNRLVNYNLISKDRIFNLGPHVNYDRVKRSKTTKKIIFYPGRFVRYKRQELAIEAFKKSTLPKKGFKLILGGFVEDRQYFEELKEMADKNISVEENLSEKRLNDLYSSCYATLFMAINEDTGLTPLESLAYGKPVISVNEGGPKEFIKDGVNGFLIEARPELIAKALDKLADKKTYRRLRQGALKSKRYNEKGFLSNLDSTISKIIRNA
ncbi:MAG: glycosyltransferase [Candidatus Parvarchaeota archaeon]|nr:glycosyltransferase [Candidatus Parvarchaeota archaeon]